MSKNITKTLAATLAATLGAGIVPVMAQTSKSLDELHKAAYTAVAVAKKDKTQKSINDARVVLAEYKAAIEAEEKLGLLPNVNTFSVQLDEVQHPILSDIVKSILAIQKAGTATQAEINEVRTMLEGDQADETDDLPKGFDSYKKTWNADLDVYQTKLMDAAIEAVKTAETEKTQATVDAAKVLVADLATAVRPGMQKIAADLQTKVEAVKVYDLKVTKAVISKTGVEVTFDALKEALRDVKLEVIDNDGKKVAVKEQSLLIEDETTYTFKFEKELSERGVGTWTVNGLEVNLDAINLVTDVQKTESREELFAILTKSGLVNNLIDEVANQDQYKKVIDARVNEEKVNTVADIQKAIDDANKNAIAGGQVKIVVKAANTSNATLSKFTTEFNKLNLERVNSEWITEYRAEIAKDAAIVELSKIQAIIDAKNVEKANEAEKDLVDKDSKLLVESKIEKAITLIEKYVVVEKDDEVNAKAKEKRINDLKIKLAIVRVNDADTQTSFKAALVNLEKVVNDKNVFEYAKLVNESLVKNYVKENDHKAVDVDGIKVYLTKGYDVAQAEAISNVTKIATEIAEKNEKDMTDKQVADLLNSLTLLSEVTKMNTTKFDLTKVNNSLVYNYATPLKAVTDVTKANEAIKGANDAIVKDIMKDASLTNTFEKLQSNKLALTNMVVANEAAYNLEHASFIGLEDIKLVAKLVDEINYKEQIKVAKTQAEIKSPLLKFLVSSKTEINGKDATELKDVEFNDMAETLLNNLNDAENPLKITNVESLKTEAPKIYDAKNQLINKVNDELKKEEPTKAATMKAFEGIDAGYKALGIEAKLLIAEKAIANKPMKNNGTKDAPKMEYSDFTDFASIRTFISSCK